MKAIDRRSLLAGSLALGASSVWRQESEPAPEDVSALGATPHTRFAVNVEMWWKELDFIQRIAMASSFGFPAIEFWGWHDKDIGAIRDVTADLEIEVAQFLAWPFDPPLCDTSNHGRFLREIKESCEIARRLKATKMTVLAGNDQPGMSREQMHANLVMALKSVVPIVEAAGVMLILEPLNTRVDHAGYCLFSSVDARRICEQVGSKMVKINWDLYHLQITEGDLSGRMSDGFDQLGYVQIADHPGRNEPGTGEIHYPRVLRQLHELGYRGYVGLECRPAEGELEAARRVHAADQW